MAVKAEPTDNKEPVQYAEEKSNELHNSMACQICIDQKIEVQELNQKLEHQIRLVEYWKAIALKHEPAHEAPTWSSDYNEKVTTELLDVPSPPPPPEKVFKRNFITQFNSDLDWPFVAILLKFINNRLFHFCSVSMWYL